MDFAQAEQHFFLAGPAGKLEIATAWPVSGAKKPVGIICHPHPLYGGTMNNKVVTTVAKALRTLGLTAVRFNFRGVGQSDGEYGHTMGEADDLRAVVAWVKQVLPDHPIWLAGFSFGSYIAALVAHELPPVQLITLAPAVNHNDFKACLPMPCPWLMIQGERDEVVPAAAVRAFAYTARDIQLVVMPDASHFFHGQLIALREILIRELQGS